VIEEISTFEGLCAIRREWADLWNRVQSTPFQSPEWLLPWWRHLFGGGEMWTIAVRKQGRLTGLAPMFIFGRRQVAFIGSGVSDYLGFLAENRETMEEIWQTIRGSCRWDICDFQEIPEGSAMLQPAKGISAERSRSSVCPVVSLPETMAELEARLSPKFRHNVRNARNRLAKLGATFEVGSDMEALFRLHGDRWGSKGEAGVLNSPCMQNFLREACVGMRRLYCIRLDGSVRGILCTFCAHQRAAYYIGGFDPELSRFSPGSALIHFAMENAIREHCTEFDFLRQGERYKYDWGATDRINTRLLLRNSESFAQNR